MISKHLLYFQLFKVRYPPFLANHNLSVFFIFPYSAAAIVLVDIVVVVIAAAAVVIVVVVVVVVVVI